jgi:threonine dehydrogenase-like Zn-dependent dehydrogenase
MKAVVQDVYGSADTLRFEDIEMPVIGDDEVLVRVRAAGVDPGVWHLMTGRPYLVRVMGMGVRRPKVPVKGRDLAGVVEAVGSRVTRFRPGDEVYGVSIFGSFAEYARSRESDLARKPANLTFEQASAVPVSGMTALQGLRDVGRVQPGQQVLVIGAAGGVGSFAVQLAHAFGAHVTGMCSTAKTDLVQSIGAEDVIDYTREEVDARGPRFDLILDTAGRRPPVVAPPGPHAAWHPGDRRRRGRRPVAGWWFRPPDPAGARPVGVLRPAAASRRLEGTHRRSGVPDHADRGRQGHTSHRPDLPAARGARGHPVPGPRSPRRQGRRHGLTTIDGANGRAPIRPTGHRIDRSPTEHERTEVPFPITR